MQTEIKLHLGGLTVGLWILLLICICMWEYVHISRLKKLQLLEKSS